MIGDEWLCQKLCGWRDGDSPDDAFVVELENTLAACTFENDYEVKEAAKALHESLRRGCFPLVELQQFCRGDKVDLKGLERRLAGHSAEVAASPVRAFIAQPFRDVSDAVYEQIIRPGCQWELVRPVRIDKGVKESDLLDKIRAGFDEANLFVADLTGNNQNVFYEIGHLEARGVEGVFLSSGPSRPMFYTQFKDIIQVRGGASGVANARRELRAALRKMRLKLDRPA
jgi:hypothetical protein